MAVDEGWRVRRWRYPDEQRMDLGAHPIVAPAERCPRLTFGAWRNLKAQVHAASGGICLYCGAHAGPCPVCDHVVPICRGGTNDFENLATSCDPCNLAKGLLTAAEFRGKLSG